MREKFMARTLHLTPETKTYNGRQEEMEKLSASASRHWSLSISRGA
jgi:hypothetical protein